MIYQDYVRFLSDSVALKSISTDPQFKDEIKKTATWLQSMLVNAGFTVDVWKEDNINPVVYAHFQQNASLPTVLVYGHYDVQPAQLTDGWDSDPFSVIEKERRLYGRGVVDNKGQLLIHMSTVLELIQEKALRCNIKFLIEGDEETGSEGLTEILKQHQDQLKCDVILISDGEMPYKPMIEASYRGVVNLTVTTKTANTGVHSGLFGGAFPNPIHELSRFIASWYGDDNTLKIPGIYDGVVLPSQQQLTEARELDAEREGMIKHTGVKNHTSEKEYGFSAQTAFLPMITVTGFKGGYIEEGYANSIPPTAEVKINIRTSPTQDPEKVFSAFESYARSFFPSYVDFHVRKDSVSSGTLMNINSEVHTCTKKLLEEVYGQKPLTNYCGGTIPIVVDFKKQLGIDPVAVPLANDDCNMHGINENFDIELIKKGLEFSRRFFSR